MIQHKKRTVCILFVLAVGLCFFSLITGSRALAYPSTGNTYGLTTEEELEKAFEALRIYNYFEAKRLFEKSIRSPGAYMLGGDPVQFRIVESTGAVGDPLQLELLHQP